jgi:ankyrin repeat protein
MKRINQIFFIFSLFITCLSYAQGELHQACFDSKRALVEQLIQSGANVKDFDSQGVTPLHYAAMKDDENSKAIINLLLDKGADVNAVGILKEKSSAGLTPLHLAARNGLKDIAQLLLNRGANVNAEDKDKSTPLDLANEYNHTEVATLLQSWSNQEKKEASNFKENSKKHRFSNGFRFTFNNMRFLNNRWLQKGAVATVFAGLIILGYRLFKRRFQLFKQR